MCGVYIKQGGVGNRRLAVDFFSGNDEADRVYELVVVSVGDRVFSAGRAVAEVPHQRVILKVHFGFEGNGLINTILEVVVREYG